MSTRLAKKNGELEGFVSVVRDITEWKRAEEQLERSSIDLAETVSHARESRDPYTSAHISGGWLTWHCTITRG